MLFGFRSEVRKELADLLSKTNATHHALQYEAKDRTCLELEVASLREELNLLKACLGYEIVNEPARKRIKIVPCKPVEG